MIVNTDADRFLPLVKHICSLDGYMSVLDNMHVQNPLFKSELKI